METHSTRERLDWILPHLAKWNGASVGSHFVADQAYLERTVKRKGGSPALLRQDLVTWFLPVATNKTELVRRGDFLKARVDGAKSAPIPVLSRVLFRCGG